MDIEEMLRQFARADWIAIVSAIIAVLSFVFNWRIVQRQSRMQAEDLRIAHDTDLIAWFHETVDVLADAQECLREAGKSYSVDEFPAKRSRARIRISAMLDRGRLYFPNQINGEEGLDREEGYQGKRQLALDVLYTSYRVVSDWPTPIADAEMTEEQKIEKKANLRRLIDARRIFVSEVFKAVDPRRRGNVLKELSQ